MGKASPKTSKPKAKAKSTGAKTKKSTGKNQLLGVIAQLAPLHSGKPPRDLVARRAGYGSGDNPSFKKALSRASQRDHVDLSDKLVVFLTTLGKDEAGEAPAIKSNKEAQETILNDLTAGQKTAFGILQDGKIHQRSDLATKLGYASEKEQGFKKLVDRISRQGYLNKLGKDSLQLSDLCFPNGRDE